MAFIINIGNANNEKIYLAVGGATRDAEMKQVGEKQTMLTKWGMAVGEKPDGSTRFVDCVAWSRVAPGASGIRKGDTVACLGKIVSREYQEKTYYDFVCDWVGPMNSVVSAAASVAAASASGGSFMDELVDADGELPF